MQLEDYFTFLAPDDIRLKGSRIGIKTILNELGLTQNHEKTNRIRAASRREGRKGEAARSWGFPP
ncbi:hypothetical protein H6G93_37695 [Nostoc sp. FACHB-973]|uniref:Uncharacterized protein n=1 Tax=Desmonostoc muscorum LEGE 12446 TaxID=1828758 RepID=A0A8J7AEU2_DESMC|nr:hypothetical protein [Desmonostoc muscorum]MBD2520577.1 hypothetical protein [Nostoc sp. FACHB-973]MCF2149140.1 hypothetical protein [Desmonostoc muscorum LEGE 12446]